MRRTRRPESGNQKQADSALRFRSLSSLLRHMLLVLALAAAGAGPATASDVGEFVGRRVVAVDVLIEGTPGLRSNEMRDMLEIAAGQDYSPVRIHDSLLRLYRSGLISGARVEGEAVGGDGVALRFIVRPQVRIDSMIFEGNPVFPTADLRARLNQLDPGQKLSAGAVSRGLSELQTFYTTRGYYQANITPEVRLDPAGTRATVVYTVVPGEQARVSRFSLDIKGAKIDLSKVKHVVKEGSPFIQSDVQDEMDRIKLAYLQQDYLAAQVTNTIKPDYASNTVAVGVEVEPGPRAHVEVQGLDLDDKEKKRVFPFYTQGGLDDFTLEEGRRRLQDYVQREGYFFAEVNKPEPPDLSASAVSLLYNLEPGQRYRLTNIEIHGADSIPHREIEDQMKSKEASFLPFFGPGRGVTSNELLRQDSNLIEKRLREIGYRRAHVDVLRGVSVGGDSLIITFDVKQGPRTYIDEITVRGNNLLTTKELTERLTIKAKDPLVTKDVGKGTDELLQAYATRGYATAEVIPEIVDVGNLDGQDRVRLVYRVIEGNRVRVLHIYTRGVARTDSERLKRDFYLFREGQWLRNDKLQQTERFLYDTNAFGSVSIHSEPAGQTVNGIEDRNVTVDLAESKRYLLIYGFGFQSRKDKRTIPGLGFMSGIRGLVQLTNTNMFGKLYTGSAQFRVAQDELLGQLSFQNPRPFGLRWPALVSVFAQRLAQTSFSTDRYSASLQTERRLSEDSIFYLNYSFERVSVFDSLVPEEDIQRNQRSVTIGRVGTSYARDKRDNAFDPSEGAFTSGSLSLASPVLGGNEQFVKLLVEHDRFYKMPRVRDVVYSVSGKLGLATPLGGKQTLPISERFFAGGAADLRGFGFEQAGPRSETDSPVGGNAQVVINNELRFPIWRVLGGAVFSDTGNVFRRVRDIKPGNFTESVGFGLRVKSPIGPLRLDVGFLVFNKPPSAPRPRVHFSFGQTF